MKFPDNTSNLQPWTCATLSAPFAQKPKIKDPGLGNDSGPFCPPGEAARRLLWMVENVENPNIAYKYGIATVVIITTVTKIIKLIILIIMLYIAI